MSLYPFQSKLLNVQTKYFYCLIIYRDYFMFQMRFYSNNSYRIRKLKRRSIFFLFYSLRLVSKFSFCKNIQGWSPEKKANHSKTCFYSPSELWDKAFIRFLEYLRLLRAYCMVIVTFFMVSANKWRLVPLPRSGVS